MHVLLGLAFIGGGIGLPIHYVNCLRKGEFPGGHRRSYIPIRREDEPIRYWLCATMFGAMACTALFGGIGIGLGLIFAVR